MEGYSLAQPFDDVEFLSICCDDPDGGRVSLEMLDGALGREMVGARRMKYFSIPIHHKERLQGLLEFTHVPHYTILLEDGIVSYQGPEMSLVTLLGALELLP